MIFSNIKGITIPEGAVKQIADGTGRILWKGGSVDVATLAIGYTGDYTDQGDVVMSGKTYRLLTITGSGTLTVSETVKADVWLCAGGNGGEKGGFGGGGGNFVQSNGIKVAKETVCVIGTGGTKTTSSTGGIAGSTAFGALTASQVTGSYKSGQGASGGGAAHKIDGNGFTAGSGCGVPTAPFLDNAMFDQHSAGGGGGGYRDNSLNYYAGGSGGSNGSDGGTRTKVSSKSKAVGGDGGEKGGGTGGSASGSTASSMAATSATFYGGGGGGGGCYVGDSSETSGVGGNGYQGVIYVRIPYEQ